MADIDELSPLELRQRRISLAVDASVALVGAFRSVLLTVDYAGTMPAYVAPPLIFEAQGPSRASYVRRVFHAPPSTILWTPAEGGAHQLTLREAAHNYWFGSLRLQVAG